MALVQLVLSKYVFTRVLTGGYRGGAKSETKLQRHHVKSDGFDENNIKSSQFLNS